MTMFLSAVFMLILAFAHRTASFIPWLSYRFVVPASVTDNKLSKGNFGSRPENIVPLVNFILGDMVKSLIYVPDTSCTVLVVYCSRMIFLDNCGCVLELSVSGPRYG
jgi:hypothetical protein